MWRKTFFRLMQGQDDYGYVSPGFPPASRMWKIFKTSSSSSTLVYHKASVHGNLHTISYYNYSNQTKRLGKKKEEAYE